MSILRLTHFISCYTNVPMARFEKKEKNIAMYLFHPLKTCLVVTM